MDAHTPKPSYQFPVIMSVPGHTIVSGPTWTVASRSRAGITHSVTIDAATGLYICTCEDHEYRRRDCCHIRLVQAGRAGKPRYGLMPKPALRAIPTFDDSDLWGDAGVAIQRSVASVRQAVAS